MPFGMYVIRSERKPYVTRLESLPETWCRTVLCMYKAGDAPEKGRNMGGTAERSVPCIVICRGFFYVRMRTSQRVRGRTLCYSEKNTEKRRIR